jgi:hypothetical protein
MDANPRKHTKKSACECDTRETSKENKKKRVSSRSETEAGAKCPLSPSPFFPHFSVSTPLVVSQLKKKKPMQVKLRRSPTLSLSHTQTYNTVEENKREVLQLC